MPQTLEVVVHLTVSEDDFDVNRLERRVEQARNEAGRELLVRVLEALDERVLENHPGGPGSGGWSGNGIPGWGTCGSAAGG